MLSSASRKPTSPGQPQRRDKASDFWRNRNGPPCAKSRLNSSLLLSESTRPESAAEYRTQEHAAKLCQYHYPGRTDVIFLSLNAAEAQGECGAKWDVPGLYVNLDKARARRQKMEAQVACCYEHSPSPGQKAAVLNWECGCEWCVSGS